MSTACSVPSRNSAGRTTVTRTMTPEVPYMLNDPTAVDWDAELVRLTTSDYALEYDRAKLLIDRALRTLAARRSPADAVASLSKAVGEGIASKVTP